MQDQVLILCHLLLNYAIVTFDLVFLNDVNECLFLDFEHQNQMQQLQKYVCEVATVLTVFCNLHLNYLDLSR